MLLIDILPWNCAEGRRSLGSWAVRFLSVGPPSFKIAAVRKNEAAVDSGSAFVNGSVAFLDCGIGDNIAGQKGAG